MGTEKEIKAGEYFFENRIPAINLMKAISSDTYKIELVKILGAIAAYISANHPNGVSLHYFSNC